MSYSTMEPKAEVNLRALFAKYVHSWYWFVLSIGIAVALAYYYIQHVTPVYQVNSVLLIRKDAQNAADADVINTQKKAVSEKNIENEIETLKLRYLMRRVVDRLNLSVNYYQNDAAGRREEIFRQSPVSVTLIGTPDSRSYHVPLSIQVLNPKQYQLKNASQNTAKVYSFNDVVRNEAGVFRVTLVDSLYRPDNNQVEIEFIDPEEATLQYLSTLKADLLNQKSTMVKLSLETTLPTKGEAVLGQLMTEYAQSVASSHDQESAGAIKLINNRLALVSGELNSIEKTAEAYKLNKGITDLSAEGNLIFESIKNNDGQLNDIQMQAQSLRNVGQYLRSSQTGLAPVSALSSDPVLVGLLSKLNSLQSEQEKYNRTTQPNNPFRQTVDAQVQSTRKAIDEYVSNQQANLLVKQNNLKQRSRQLNSSIQAIPRKEREFLTIKRQQTLKENIYLMLLQKREETAIAYAAKMRDSQVMDAPYSTPYPIKPNRSGTYLLAVFAGLLIPIGFIGLKGAMGDKVKSRLAIERETGVPVLAEIIKRGKRSKSDIIDLKSSSIIAEQFRMVRANLQYLTRNQILPLGHTVMLTSSVSGEGKSFIAINLANSMALLGKKVVVLELDLRKPQIGRYLNMRQQSHRGISDYLNGQADYEDIVQQTTLNPNLYVIQSGPIPTNPTELLSNGAIQSLIDQLRHEFDYIILDTPPVSMIADATLLSDSADVTFFVVRHEYTPRNYMRLLANLHDSQRFRSLHVIINAVNYTNGEDFGYGYAYVSNKTY